MRCSDGRYIENETPYPDVYYNTSDYIYIHATVLAHDRQLFYRHLPHPRHHCFSLFAADNCLSVIQNTTYSQQAKQTSFAIPPKTPSRIKVTLNPTITQKPPTPSILNQLKSRIDQRKRKSQQIPSHHFVSKAPVVRARDHAHTRRTHVCTDITDIQTEARGVAAPPPTPTPLPTSCDSIVWGVIVVVARKEDP